MKNFKGILLSIVVLLVAVTTHAQPTIISQPVSTSSAVGSTVGFSVAASGTGTLYYQWRNNGTNMLNGAVSGAATISGATTAALTLTGITTNNQSSYSCRITNSTGSVTSSIATLTVIVSPTITAHPVSVNTNVGANVTFRVTAAGTLPYTYQWYKDGVVIPSATLSTYAINGVFLGDSGAYSVRVSNAAGSTTSSNAILNVGTPISITAPPGSLVVTQGQSASFSVTATGTAPAYFWRKNGTFIPGQTNSTFNIGSTVPTNAATYTCQVSNFLGSVTSSGAILTVNYAPVISVQPVSQTIGVGSNFTVSVTASGVPAVAYQWRTNGTAIPGATASSYTVINTRPDHAGAYTVVVTNSLGGLTSSVANITVVEFGPTIKTPPVGGNVAVGNGFTLTATASGTAPLNWQWFKDGTALTNAATVTTNLTGNTSFGYTNASAQLADAGSYWVVVNNAAGSATSSVAVVNVGYAPVVTQQPLSLTNVLGATASFSCVVTGSAPISLQWTLFGNPIVGATNASLTLTNLQPANIGYYALRATNLFGGTVSSTAALNLIGYDFGIWNGLVAYYPFNGSANDESGNGRNGVLENCTATNNRFGQANGAYSFNGSNSRIQAGGNWFHTNSARSVSVWMKVSALHFGNMVTFGDGNSSLANKRFSLSYGFNGSYVHCIGNYNDYPFSVPDLTGGIWQHFAITYDGTTGIIFKNGKTLGSFTTGFNTDGTFPMVVGSDSTNRNDEFFLGQLDDIRIYNRALSGDEVAYLYQMESQVTLLPMQTLSATTTTNSALQLNLIGQPGRSYILQAATNLALPIQWQSLLTNAANTNGVWQFTETNLNSIQKFYRVTAP